MDTLEQDICAGIDRFIKLQIPFAIYRIPGENVVHFVSKDPGDSCVLLYDIEELNGQAGFVIAPFNVGPTTPIVLLRPEREMVVDFDPALKCPGGIQPDVYRQMLNNQVVSLQDGSSTEGYAGRFDVFMDTLKKKEFNKLVLSRSQKVNVPLLFSPATAFYEACRRYIVSAEELGK